MNLDHSNLEGFLCLKPKKSRKGRTVLSVVQRVSTEVYQFWFVGASDSPEVAMGLGYRDSEGRSVHPALLDLEKLQKQRGRWRCPGQLQDALFSLSSRLRTPPTWQRSQNPPRLKKSKKSLRESLWGSLRGSWPTPQNE